MSINPAYPPVRETPENEAMLKAWREQGELLLQQCGECGAQIYYPRAVCPHCWSFRLDWVAAEGSGKIVSFSRVHRGLPDVFMDEVPIVLAEIALAEGVLMIARVICDAETVATGDAVRLLPAREAASYPLPTFATEVKP